MNRFLIPIIDDLILVRSSFTQVFDRAPVRTKLSLSRVITAPSSDKPTADQLAAQRGADETPDNDEIIKNNNLTPNREFKTFRRRTRLTAPLREQ
jgi:hypothetical protein